MTLWTDSLGAETRYRDAAGWRTRSIEAGEGDAVILMGGLTGHAEGFLRNVVPLAERGLRVHAIDALGHGLTARPTDVTYHAPVFTEHLIGFLDAIGAEKAHLVGQSLGGWTALHTALKHPDRVGKVVSVTGAGLLLSDAGRAAESERVHAQVKSVTAKAAAAPTRESVRERLEWLMVDPATVTDELVECRYRYYTLPGAEEALAKLVAEQPSEANRAHMLTEEHLASIRHETLVLWSDRNPTTPAEVGRRAAQILPNASFDMITGAGHWPMFEQPEQFNRVVGDFLVEGAR
ncbi:2-hydroxy-6-oxonona-2,4-dienedioate hydrolase/2-hydroxy-6-oxo-6-(2'-carboxyphenyl)-hexa-2,4-dienoate hydrolase [Actinocorallia herbida]|uniref:2-hydroxy-6-oxonona-2,4-dienedioate hydrolase/2-hydroxy-6-oxo-6-(2'-carboxyphenyl)-hexa-2, 4-dienoate hydrolase n=1 Tax=Actinocorallia herbida TaxID=58109 RepID=A0A3N1CUL7_9ACTN|nr:alpha/beta fold hydrolase [Actinocorallia herbida]ROO84996.1 2-hydroxy-6-oxonona-2,4-dienedioate hydrolase/2-hydroxy-6-oxo-6-(2'-carboxyphenyl)-hexa-2,4-dienoate hydrolase [Actinocorallia herbida]